jgi:hypothetical protein
MIVDRYTKAVLTVIAGCLVWICLMQMPGTVLAQQTARELATVSHAVQPVVLVGVGAMDGNGKVMIYYSQHNGAQWTDPQTAPLSVELTSVKKVGDWDPVRTHVEPASARDKPGGGHDDR